MVILAIDPGYDRCGWAVGEKEGSQIKLLGYGCIQTHARDSQYQRYLQVIQELKEIIAKFDPDVGVLETLFFSKNQKTALKVSEIRGVILGLYLAHEMKIVEFMPSQIKIAVTGHGKADKKAVEKMVRLQLKLTLEKLIDDTIDALAILITSCVIQQR